MKDLPIRKMLRLKNYDYSSAGYYFITICVENKQKILGNIVWDTDPGVPVAGDGVPGVPSVRLSEYGKAIDTRLNLINEYYSHVSIEKYVIMPNHLHMIVHVHGITETATEMAEDKDNGTTSEKKE